MTFTQAVESVFTRCLDFSGRARRREFWYFVLFVMLAGMVVEWVGQVFGQERLFEGILTLVLILPFTALAFRRLHDTGRSGCWYLLSFVPLLSLIPIIFYCLDSQPGANQYGLNPKETFYQGPEF